MQTLTQLATVVPASEGRKLHILGHSVTVKLARKETGGRHYVFDVVTPPGLGIPAHVHDREDEMIYVVEGEFGIRLHDREFVARTGDEIYFPRHIAHAFQNIGSTAGRTLWTVVPGGNFEEFFDQLGALPPGPPDLKRVAEIFAAYGMDILAK